MVLVAVWPAVIDHARVQRHRIEHLVGMSVRQFVLARNARPQHAGLRVDGERNGVADAARFNRHPGAVELRLLDRRPRRIEIGIAIVARRADTGEEQFVRHSHRRGDVVARDAAGAHRFDLARRGARGAIAGAIRQFVHAELRAEIHPLAVDRHARHRVVGDLREHFRRRGVALRVGHEVDRVARGSDEEVAVGRDGDFAGVFDRRDPFDREPRCDRETDGRRRGPNAGGGKGRAQQRLHAGCFPTFT